MTNWLLFWQEEKEGRKEPLNLKFENNGCIFLLCKNNFLLWFSASPCSLLSYCGKCCFIKALDPYDRYVLMFLIVGKTRRKAADKLEGRTLLQSADQQSQHSKLAISGCS